MNILNFRCLYLDFLFHRKLFCLNGGITLSRLPKKNELGFFEIRLESIGGLGANLAGKMLAEAGVLSLGLKGSSFSSYGSEKKGSPVKSFIRFCDPDVEIR